MNKIDNRTAINGLLEIFLKRPNADYGLYYGKVGIMLLHCMISKNNCFLYEQTINTIESTIHVMEDYSFSKGLPGIGWGVQIMLETGHISSQYNILLSDLDNLIYQKVANQRSQSLSLFSSGSALAKTLYFYQRTITEKCTYPGYYQDLANRECLILLTTEISELLSVIIGNKRELISKRSASLLEIGQSFVILHRLLLGKINKDYIRKILLHIREFIYNYFNERPYVSADNAHNILYLLYAHVLVSFENSEVKMKINSEKWAKEILPQILPHIDSYTDLFIVDKIKALCGINIEPLCNFTDDLGIFSLWTYLGFYMKNYSKNIDTHFVPLRIFLLE